MIAFDVTSNRKLKKLLNLNSQLRIRAAVSGFADGGLAARATGALVRAQDRSPLGVSRNGMLIENSVSAPDEHHRRSSRTEQ